MRIVITLISVCYISCNTTNAQIIKRKDTLKFYIDTSITSKINPKVSLEKGKEISFYKIQFKSVNNPCLLWYRNSSIPLKINKIDFGHLKLSKIEKLIKKTKRISTESFNNRYAMFVIELRGDIFFQRMVHLDGTNQGTIDRVEIPIKQ